MLLVWLYLEVDLERMIRSDLVRCNPLGSDGFVEGPSIGPAVYVHTLYRLHYDIVVHTDM